MNKLLPPIAHDFGLQPYIGDYYTIDAIFYETKDTEFFPEEAHYAHAISVAIEHENYLHSSHCEMNKLQLFNAPLKVLIVYPRTDDQRSKYLADCNEIVRSADWADDMATSCRQLVIFGEKPDDLPVWRFYQFEPKAFTRFNSDRARY